MQVRIARPSDEEAVSKLLGRSYPALMAPSYDPGVLAFALPSMTTANRDLLASGTYYVAENDGCLVGCGGWAMEQPGSRETEAGLAHLRHFATETHMTRKGVGRSIFERCAIDAVEQGTTRFRVFAALNSEPFYLSLGMARIKAMGISMGPITFSVVLMEGSLV